jgi:hypothetical protein
MLRVDCTIYSFCVRFRAHNLSSYKLNRQRNNRINGYNCRGIAVMCVQCILRIDDNAK